MIENTRNQPHELIMPFGSRDRVGYIEAMEARGQQQLVNSEMLPTDTGGTDDEFITLGFTFGAPDPQDPLFRPATLPQGWRRAATDHSMGSELLDERGIARVGIFYKAAWYDRSANMYLMNVGNRLANRYIYGDEPNPDIPWGKLTAEEVEKVQQAAKAYMEQVREHPHIYGERAPRAQQLLDDLEGKR